MSVVGLAWALAACGGLSAPKANEAALKRGLLASGELAGMVPQPISLVRSAKAQAQSEQLVGSALTAEAARERRIGFVASASEQLSSSTDPAKGGLTLVEQFSSPKGPPAEIAHTMGQATGPWNMFAVPGVPGARGFDQTSGTNGGRNVAFAHGDYMYLIGSGWSGGAANSVSRAKLIAVAQQLYKRVAG